MTSAVASDFQSFRARKRFANLDGLRFVCISVVLLHHAGFSDFGPWRAASRGFLGVDFFFVLSGFLITTLLLREESREGRFSFRGFYWRRFLRIIPVYYFVVTACTLYYGLIKGQEDAFARAPFYYFFLSNFLEGDTPLLGPTWSLSVEEQYYVVWPLLLAFVRRTWIVPLLVFTIALNVAVASGVFDAWVEEPFSTGYFVLALPNATYAPILLGSLIAILLHDERSFGVLSRAFGHRWAPPSLLLVLLLICQFGPGDLEGLPNLAIHLTMAAITISLVTDERTVLSPFLTWQPVVRIGEVSYGIYLYHLIALHVATVGQQKLLGTVNPWISLVVMYAVSILIAELSYRTLEAFFRSLRRRPPFGLVGPETTTVR